MRFAIEFSISPKVAVSCKNLKEGVTIFFLQAGWELSEGWENFAVQGDLSLYWGVIGTEQFRNDFLSGKVEKWMKDVNKLAEIAKEEPQTALCSYNTVGLSQRWTFVQRTIKDIGFIFEPLEEAIRNILIPAICGKVVSDIERKLISLPYKYGGLGMRNPVESCLCAGVSKKAI